VHQALNSVGVDCAPSANTYSIRVLVLCCTQSFRTKGSDRWYIFTVPCVHIPVVRLIEDLAFLLAVFSQGTPQDVESTVYQDDPQDTDLKRGAIARNWNVSVTTDTLLDLSDPQHQPGSMTVHHRTPSPKQGLVDDPQNDGQDVKY